MVAVFQSISGINTGISVYCALFGVTLHYTTLLSKFYVRRVQS